MSVCMHPISSRAAHTVGGTCDPEPPVDVFSNSIRNLLRVWVASLSFRAIILSFAALSHIATEGFETVSVPERTSCFTSEEAGDVGMWEASSDAMALMLAVLPFKMLRIDWPPVEKAFCANSESVYDLLLDDGNSS